MNEFHDEIGLQHSKSLISNMGRRQDSLVHDDDSSGTEEDEDEIRLFFPNNESTRNPSKFNLQLFQSKASFRKHKWNEKIKPDLSNFLSEQEDLEQFQSLYAAGLTSYKYLYSLGYIIWSNKSQLQEVCTNYNENLQVVASYLVRRTHKRDLKLHALRTLMMCLSPLEASWQVCDPVIEGTLDYLLGEVQWEFMEHTQMDLILELRAICLGQIERERQRVARVGRTGDIAAVLISAGAKIIEAGIQSSESMLSNQLEAAGDKLKRTVRPQAYPLFMDRDAIVALCWSDAAKRASASAKIGSRKAVMKLRDVSNRGLEAVADQLAKENSALEQKLPPEGSEALRAIGKVGMASLGAAAVVGEALVESSRVVVKKTSVVSLSLRSSISYISSYTWSISHKLRNSFNSQR